MKVSNRTITALQMLITGDPVTDGGEPLAPYRGGPKLVAFFNEFGFDDIYPRSGFPSRWDFTETRLRRLNDTLRLRDVILAALHPGEFITTQFNHDEAVNYLNQFLELDGFKLIRSGNHMAVSRTTDSAVVLESELDEQCETLGDFIREQLDKCDTKLQSEDYDGAITNARSLVEAVLLELESRLVAEQQRYDGNLPKLNRRVVKALNLDPARKDVSDSLRQVLSGLTSIVNGIAPLRNALGDAHAQEYKPQRHHAKLAVNSAKTICDFFFDSFEYQVGKGLIEDLRGTS